MWADGGETPITAKDRDGRSSEPGDRALEQLVLQAQVHEYLGRVGGKAECPSDIGYPGRLFEQPNAMPIHSEGTGGGEARESCVDDDDVQLQSKNGTLLRLSDEHRVLSLEKTFIFMFSKATLIVLAGPVQLPSDELSERSFSRLSQPAGRPFSHYTCVIDSRVRAHVLSRSTARGTTVDSLGMAWRQLTGVILGLIVI